MLSVLEQRERFVLKGEMTRPNTYAVGVATNRQSSLVDIRSCAPVVYWIIDAVGLIMRKTGDYK